jgi:hypothetical protein
MYVPNAVYVCDGFCSVDVPPSPNSQFHAVGDRVDRSWNCTVMGTVVLTLGVALNAATGASGSVPPEVTVM